MQDLNVLLFILVSCHRISEEEADFMRSDLIYEKIPKSWRDVEEQINNSIKKYHESKER